MERAQVVVYTEDVPVSSAFRSGEFQCKDGSPVWFIDNKLIIALQALRDRVKVPVEIISGYRTPEHNRKVGGEEKSYHMRGQAADVRVRGISPEVLARMCRQLPYIGGVGLYDQFVHIDTGPTRSWRG